MKNAVHLAKVTGSIIVILIIIFLILAKGFIGRNNVQDFQIIQSIRGDIEIRTVGGYYTKFFPKIWTYPKVVNVFFSADTREGSPGDESISVRFKNKGTGQFSTRVTYRLLGSKEAVMKMHENCGGNTEISDGIVLSKLKEIARVAASQMTSSEAIEQQEKFIAGIRKQFVGNISLKGMGITVNKVELTDLNFDTDTLALFKAQQKAILLGKQAESKEIQYKMELKETMAKYKKQIAEESGKAEMKKMTAVTDAQREKELAEISANKKVSVAEFEKKEALIRQQKLVEMAELMKQEALVKAKQKEEIAQIELVQARLDAQSKIALAEARQKEIQLSGAITEKERVLAEILAGKQVAIAKAYGTAIAGATFPKTIIMGSGKDSGDAGLFKMWMMSMIDQKKTATPAK
jgi:SPFH domain / Band 7 family